MGRQKGKHWYGHLSLVPNTLSHTRRTLLLFSSLIILLKTLIPTSLASLYFLPYHTILTTTHCIILSFACFRWSFNWLSLSQSIPPIIKNVPSPNSSWWTMQHHQKAPSPTMLCFLLCLSYEFNLKSKSISQKQPFTYCFGYTSAHQMAFNVIPNTLYIIYRK